jgi:hypothetical protein
MLLRTSKPADWTEGIESTVQLKVGTQEQEACPPTREKIPVINLLLTKFSP